MIGNPRRPCTTCLQPDRYEDCQLLCVPLVGLLPEELVLIRPGWISTLSMPITAWAVGSGDDVLIAYCRAVTRIPAVLALSTAAAGTPGVRLPAPNAADVPGAEHARPCMHLRVDHLLPAIGACPAIKCGTFAGC